MEKEEQFLHQKLEKLRLEGKTVVKKEVEQTLSGRNRIQMGSFFLGLKKCV